MNENKRFQKFNFEPVEEMSKSVHLHYDRLRFGERKLIVKQKIGCLVLRALYSYFLFPTIFVF